MDGIFEFTKKAVSYGPGGPKWQATWKNKGKTGESIQIRKTFKQPGQHTSTCILLIVALDGWKYKTNEWPGASKLRTSLWSFDTKGLNVRFSINGCLMGGWDILDQIQQVIDEAKELLEIEDVEQREAWILLRYLGN